MHGVEGSGDGNHSSRKEDQKRKDFEVDSPVNQWQAGNFKAENGYRTVIPNSNKRIAGQLSPSPPRAAGMQPSVFSAA